MRTTFYCCFLLCGLFGAGRARADFHPGYVITLAGDTVRGKVDYQTGPPTTFKCRFRPASGPAVTYEPEQLLGYGLTDISLTYQVRRVPTVVVLNAIEGSAHTEMRPVFLEVLVAGPATLYYRADETEKTHYYVYTEASGMHPLLTENVTVTDANGRTFLRERPLFRGELATAFQACPEVQRTVATVMLTKSSLSKAVRHYNACITGESLPAGTALDEPRYVSLEAMLGAQYSTIRFSGETQLQGTTIGGGLVPLPGVAVQLRPPLLRQRLRLRVEALYERQRYDEEFNNPAAFPYARRQHVRVALDNIHLPVTVRYYLLSSRLQPFLEAGISVGFNFKNENEYRYTGLPGGAYSRWEPALSEPDRIQQGGLAGIGLGTPLANGHALSLGLRGEQTTGLTDRFGTRIYQARYLLLSYGLSKTEK